MLDGWQVVSMAPLNNITSVLSVSRFIPHVIKQCQHVHLQQLQQSWLISSVVYLIIIVAPAEKSLVTLWPCYCKMPSPPNENLMALHLTRRQDLSHTDHHSAPSEAQECFAAHPVIVVLLKKDIFSFGFLQNTHWTFHCHIHVPWYGLDMILDAG